MVAVSNDARMAGEDVSMIVDWDDAYNSASYIAEADLFPKVWAARAAEFCSARSAAGRAELGLAYGASERERLDLFHADGRREGPRGVRPRRRVDALRQVVLVAPRRGRDPARLERRRAELCSGASSPRSRHRAPGRPRDRLRRGPGPRTDRPRRALLRGAARRADGVSRRSAGRS